MLPTADTMLAEGPYPALPMADTTADKPATSCVTCETIALIAANSGLGGGGGGDATGDAATIVGKSRDVALGIEFDLTAKLYRMDPVFDCV